MQIPIKRAFSLEGSRVRGSAAVFCEKCGFEVAALIAVMDVVDPDDRTGIRIGGDVTANVEDSVHVDRAGIGEDDYPTHISPCVDDQSGYFCHSLGF